MEKFAERNPMLSLAITLVVLATIFAILNSAIDSGAALGFIGVILGGAISAITSILIAREKHKAQFTMVALEKRLQAHQDAYSQWWNMRHALNEPDKLIDIVNQAKEWWINNSLFLEPKAREAFSRALNAASYRIMIFPKYGPQPRTKEESDEIRKNWEEFVSVGKVIVESIALPVLREDYNIVEGESKL